MQKFEKIPVLAVIGPTASGKTALAVQIAKALDGEIISCDSMQIYKELNISTAKPTAEEMQGIKHHMIDIKSVSEDYSVADYVSDATIAVQDVISRNKIPIFAGGTGLYIDSFLKNIQFNVDNHNDEIRKNLELQLETVSSECMLQKLYEIDEKTAKTLHPNNQKKIIRALEVYYTTGKTMSEQLEESRKKDTPYIPLYIGMNFKNRQILYDRINLRVDNMLKLGLVDEVKRFFECNPGKTAMQAIGCKEIKPYLDGKATINECIEKLKMESRRYAKRQITWFKRNSDINWLYPDENEFPEICDKAISIANEFLNSEV